ITIDDDTDIDIQTSAIFDLLTDTDGSIEFAAQTTIISNASKASFKFQGITIEDNKNNDIEIIAGKLSVSLKQEYPSSINVYTSTINNTKVIERLNNFVINYNELNDFIILQNHRDANGLLSDESVLSKNQFFQDIAYKVRHLLDSKCFYKLGIDQSGNGELQFDEQEYIKYYQANKNDLKELIDDTEALSNELQTLYDQNFLAEIYNLQTDNNNENTTIAKIIEKNKKEENIMRRKYADLEKKLGDLDLTMDLIDQDFQYRTSR
ncbi:MAG: flagellar filament capping protein FliD, partial [Anaplasmataceae bacterium]|nr:flagellar filament capping protein FliD [Anaplasmataceae bacterium]